MKKSATIIAAVLLGAGLLSAHEMQGGSTSGLFGLKPEYLHVLLNPLPGYGLMVGVAVLVAGFVFKQPVLRTAGLIIVALCAAAAWPVLYFGQHGYNNLYPQIDTESQQWLDTHMSRAERFIYIFYATAALALAALIGLKKFPKAAFGLSAVTLFASFGCLGVGAWISRAGGEVSHSEFRVEGVVPSASPAHTHDTHQKSSQTKSPPAETDDHSAEHAASKHAHGEPQTTNAAHEDHTATDHAQHDHVPDATNVPHQHSPATNAPAEHQAVPENHQHAPEPTLTTNAPVAHAHSQPPASGARLPDTPEAIWTALHHHHQQLAEAIKTNDTGQIHANAVSIEKLGNALVAVVHPDHKAVVQKGADQIITAVRAVHTAAHADDPAAVETNFKLLEQSLDQLEQQMKKQ